MEIQGRDIGEWTDDNPLNKRLTQRQEYLRLFAGDEIVDEITSTTPVKKDNKPFATDVLGNDIYMAESDEIKKAGSNVNRLMKLIAPFMGWKDGGQQT
jgi:hypothetical protein